MKEPTSHNGANPGDNEDALKSLLGDPPQPTPPVSAPAGADPTPVGGGEGNGRGSSISLTGRYTSAGTGASQSERGSSQTKGLGKPAAAARRAARADGRSFHTLERIPMTMTPMASSRPRVQ